MTVCLNFSFYLPIISLLGKLFINYFLNYSLHTSDMLNLFLILLQYLQIIIFLYSDFEINNFLNFKQTHLSHLLCHGFCPINTIFVEVKPVQLSFEVFQARCSHNLRWEEVPLFKNSSSECRSSYNSIGLFRNNFHSIIISLKVNNDQSLTWFRLQKVL